MDLPAYVTFKPPRSPPQPEPAISVVIPAYNEASRIGPYLASIEEHLSAAGEPHEIIVVNDGSADRTAECVRQRMDTTGTLGLVSYPRNMGKGHAVRMGLLAARGRLRLFADADGSTPISELARLRGCIERDGADIAIGSRALPAPDVKREIRLHRYCMGQVFRALRQAILRVDVQDSQCGFKLFTGRAADIICPAARLDGFAFDVEWLHLASRAGLRVVEVPVNWRDSGESRVRLLTDPFRMVRDLWRVRRLHRKTVLPSGGGPR